MQVSLIIRLVLISNNNGNKATHLWLSCFALPYRHLQAAATYLLIQALPTRTCCWTASPALPELICWLVSFSCLQHICHPATWSWTEMAGRIWQIRHLFSAHGVWQAAGASQSRQARDVEPFAHPLSNAAITAAIPIKIHCHSNSSCSCPYNLYPICSQQHSHSISLHAAAGDGPVQGTPLPCCCSPASSV